MKTFAAIIEDVKKLSRAEKEDLYAMLDKTLSTTLKTRVRKAIDNAEESVLEQVYAFLEKARKKNRPTKPMTMQEFRDRIAKSEKEIRQGKGIPHEEAKRRFGIK